MKKTYTRQEVVKLLGKLSAVAVDIISYLGEANYPFKVLEAKNNLNKKYNELTRKG